MKDKIKKIVKPIFILLGIIYVAIFIISLTGYYESLENKKKPGNPLSKYLNKKNLTDIEKLQYENMKLRIENERLKKGYLVKGDGSVVVFKK